MNEHRTEIDSTIDRMNLKVGNSMLCSPVITAAGCSGHGTELSAYGDLSTLGAVTVKSLSKDPYAGNEPPRMLGINGGMINSVGLQNEGVKGWYENWYKSCKRLNVTTVVSIFGFSIEDYVETIKELQVMLEEDRSTVKAIEINASCPNVANKKMFSQDADLLNSLIRAVKEVTIDIDLWVKLSPQVSDLLEIAEAAISGGASSLTLTNTLAGTALDKSGKSLLGAKSGGISYDALHPVALKIVSQVRERYKDIGIIGVGGVKDLKTALDFFYSGADAVAVGTHNFIDPRFPWKLVEELEQFQSHHGLKSLKELRVS